MAELVTRPKRGNIAAAAVASAAVAFAFFSVAAHERTSEGGDVVAEGRERVDVGAHVVAVLEPGARLQYEVAPALVRGERVVIDQRAGRVLYRADDAAHARIETAAGAVVVDGAGAVVVEVRGAVGTATVGALDGVTRVEGAREEALAGGDTVELRAGHAPRALGEGEAAAFQRDDDEATLASIDDDSADARRNLERALADMRAVREKLRASGAGADER